MGWFLGAFTYIALDVVVMAVALVANVRAVTAGTSRSKRAEIGWWVTLPLMTVSFVQFWVLAHTMLWPQLVIVLALGAISWYVSVVAQSAMRLRTVGNQNKLLVSSFIRGMDVNKVGTGMIGYVSLAAYILADFLVLRTYLSGALVGPDRIVALAVVHFTVRGTLLLISSVLLQTVVATNKEYDDDVRYSLTVSQLAGIIGAVYLILVPLFTYAPAAIRGGPLPSFFTSVPVWALFACYLGVYLSVWTLGFVSSSFQHATQSGEFAAWRAAWLDRTRSILSVGDPDERRTDIEESFGRLLNELSQFRDSTAVSQYTTFLLDPAAADELVAATQQPQSGAELRADVEQFVAASRGVELPTTSSDLFTTYRYNLDAWDLRFYHVHALLTYAHFTSLYLIGTSTDAEYLRILDHQVELNAKSKPSAGRQRFKFVASIVGALTFLSAVFKFVEQWYPALKKLLLHP